ncbi:hypothetical protein FQA39_LY06740 [Lamprigera yunnana]|nr:hypothetical protein FQA39_LY06740 [Lamprigera yunnana]
MNSKSIKIRDGVKTFLNKAKAQSVPLHLGAILTFDTDSCENNTVEAGEIEQSIDLLWSIPDDYDANNEACLLRYGNAAEEMLINSHAMIWITRVNILRLNIAHSSICSRKNNVLLDIYEWEKFTELESYMTNQFFYGSSEIKRVLNQSSKVELSIQNMCKNDDITDDVTVSYHWKYVNTIKLNVYEAFIKFNILYPPDVGSAAKCV